MATFPLPRKLPTGGQIDAKTWKVHPTCVALWNLGRGGRRQDTYIGILDTDTWILYVVPCFGMEPAEARKRKLIGQDDKVDGRVENDLRKRLATHDGLTPDTEVVSGSTARENDAARRVRWGDLTLVYGNHGVCVAPFSEGAARGGKGFDGISHTCLRMWVENHITPPPLRGDSSGTQSWWFRALGFAIQRDDLSYLVRFSSTLNQMAGQTSHPMFVERTHAPRPTVTGEMRDPRDMPKEWAEEIVKTLSRDLHLGRFNDLDIEQPNPSDSRDRSRGKTFGRMLARNDKETTKFKRLRLT